MENKRLSNQDIGKCIYVANSNDNFWMIIRVDRVKEEVIDRGICIGTVVSSLRDLEYDRTCCYTDVHRRYRDATSTEIAYLDTCISKKGYIPMDEFLKNHNPSLLIFN